MRKFLVVCLVVLGVATIAGASAWFVGIGTETPLVPLHVAQDIFTHGNLGGQLLLSTETQQVKGLNMGFSVESSSEEGFGWLQSGHYAPGVTPYLPLMLNVDGGNVSVGSPEDRQPSSKLTVYNGDVEIAASQQGSYGVVMHSGSGNCARVLLEDDYTLSVVPINCPQ